MNTLTMSDRNKGFYNKFDVKRRNDVDGKHDECSYFVLDLKHDPFAKMALAVYAFQCRDKYPLLALDLLDIVFMGASME